MPNYPYRNLGIPLDLENWEALNRNFDDVENDIKSISGNVLAEVINGAKLNYLSPVQTFSDLGTTYPDASEGDVSQTLDDNKIYRFDGSTWLFLQQFGAGPFTEIYERLDEQKYHLSVAEFGAVGDGITDDTDALTAAINSITENTELLFPGKAYVYTSLPNMAKRNVTYRGLGSGGTKLVYNGSGTALTLDAFAAGNPSDPFIDNCNLQGFSIVGDNMTIGVFAQGISRSQWRDLRVNGSNGADGTIAYSFKGCMLNHFSSLFTSYTDGVLPYRGFMFQPGTRAGASVGACSNNLIDHIYAEGNKIGIQIVSNGGDQNVFNVGAPEKCVLYGLLVGANCRYNTFIGLGCENLGVANADIDDSGTYSKFINCYSNEKVYLKGKGAQIQGGFFERVEVTSSASESFVDTITVNNWNTGAGGFYNFGSGTRYHNIYDADTATYQYKNKARYAVAVTGSPFQWTNIENVPVKVRLIGGTVTQVLMFRGTDFWEEPKPTAGNTVTQGIYLLAPGDKIDVSYSVAPTMNVISLNNI